MNRNKQRQMLKMKREIGFHDVGLAMDCLPMPNAPAPDVPIWEGIVKVQYSQAGAAGWLVYNKDRSLYVEMRRSQYTRTAWNKLLEKLGMHPKEFWIARRQGTGELDFVRRTMAEEW